MRKIYPLLIVLITSCSSIFAQQTTFQAAYSFGSFNIPILTDIIQNPAGQYVMTGTDGTIPILGTVTTIDSAANVIWSKEYTASGFETEIVDVKNVSSGGYIVAGASDNGLLLIRLDVNGNVTWSNTYHVASGTSENASRVLPASDGGFVVAGYVYNATPPGYARQDSANCYILKVNSAGTLLWAKVVFCSVTYINDHVLNDVAEATDGYVFVGSMSQGASDNAGTYGLALKTDFNGNVTYIKHWGASGDDAEATSITSLTTAPGHVQVVGGNDGEYSTIATFNSNTGTATGYRYGNGFLPALINFNAVPTFDGNYAMIGMAASLGISSYVLKVNSSTGAVIWGEQYTGGFASLLPEGRQVADSGFIMVTTALGGTGYEYLLVKTNALGASNPTGCTSSTFNPSKATYSPAYTAFTPDSIVTTTRSTVAVLGVAVNPRDSINCIAVVCTAPATPTATATPGTVCPNGSSTISGGSGITYKVYDASTGGNLLGTAPLVVHPTTTTTYYVEAQSGVGCVSNSRQALTITVTQVPTAVGPITGSLSPCVGTQAYSISAVTNATTYAWSVSGGGSVTAGGGTTNVTVTWTTAGGPYTVSVSASNSCATVSNSINVTVGSSPGAATATASPNPACAGQNVTLSFPSTGATTYSWTGPGGYTSSSPSPVITGILANAGGTYSVTASNNCGTVTGSVNLVVNAIPTAASATASPNPACQGQTVNLTGSGTGATAYSWTGPGNYISAQQSPALTNVQANQGGTYTLVATNACGNDTATLNLVINTTPTAVVPTAAPNPVCIGGTVNLNASATGATSYAWAGPNGFTDNTATTSLSNFQNASAGVYTLTATNACGNSTASVTVNIATAPTGVSASANHPTTCYATNVQLTGTAAGATTYGWTGPEGFVSSQQDTGLTNATVAESGTYIFTATNNCGSTTGSVVVTVDTIIQGFLAAAAGGDTLCAGYQLALSGTGTDVNNWLWTGPNGFVSTSQDTTVTNAVVLNNGQYILTASNACQTLRDTLNIHVESGNTIHLVASSSASHDSACFGNTINLFATDSFDSYNWTGPDGFVSYIQNPVITNATVAQSGNYVVTGVNRCGRKTDSVTVHIDTIPQGLQLTSTGINNTSCQGQSITVTASSPGVNNWAWTGPAGFTSTNASFTIANIQPNQQGNYIVTATNACGSAVDTIVVRVNALPDSLFVNTSSDSICPGVALVLTARSGLTNVVWSGGQTGNSINATQPGTYSYTGNDGNGCAVTSDTIHLYNANAPVLNLFANNPTAVCVGQPPVVLHASSDASVSFVWSPGGATTDSLVVTQPGVYSVVGAKSGCYVKDSIDVASGTIPSATFGSDSVLFTCCTNPEVTPVVSGAVATYQWSDSNTGSTDLLTQSGTYTLTVTTNQGCTATASVNFNKICIGAQALAIPDSVQVGDAASLHVTTTITNGLTYQWTPADSISNSAIADPMANPQQTTTYSVIVRDTLSGCVDTSSVTLYVLYQANFAIPNVFAPNNGGPNSTWYVINQGGLVTVEDMKVFDRWGEEVFDSQRDGTINWNGRYEGKLQPMGNYVYMVKVKILASGKEQVVRGNLSLIW